MGITRRRPARKQQAVCFFCHLSLSQIHPRSETHSGLLCRAAFVTNAAPSLNKKSILRFLNLFFSTVARLSFLKDAGSDICVRVPGGDHGGLQLADHIELHHPPAELPKHGQRPGGGKRPLRGKHAHKQPAIPH